MFNLRGLALMAMGAIAAAGMRVLCGPPARPKAEPAAHPHDVDPYQWGGAPARQTVKRHQREAAAARRRKAERRRQRNRKGAE